MRKSLIFVQKESRMLSCHCSHGVESIWGLFGLVLVVLWCLWDQLLMLYTDRGRGWFQIPPEMFNGRVSVWLRLNWLVIIWPCLGLWGLVWVDLNCWIAKCVLAVMRSWWWPCWFCPCLGRQLWPNWTALAEIAWPGCEDCELCLGRDREMTIVADCVWLGSPGRICFLTSLSGLLRAHWQQRWKWRSGRGTGSQLQRPEGEGQGKIKKAHVCERDTKKTQESEQGENRERKTVCLSKIKTERERERGRKRFCGGTESFEGGSGSVLAMISDSVSLSVTNRHTQTPNNKLQTWDPLIHDLMFIHS